MTSRAPAAKERPGYVAALSLGALGIVYGDIGTSPLYALRESFHPSHGLGVSPDSILGVLSLVVWALLFVVSLKYLVFVLRADRRGEGGMLSLSHLAQGAVGSRRQAAWVFLIFGLIGAALLYGDGMITPAISVMSAVEGLEVATPFFEPYVIPITIAILIGLFSVQSHGTGGIGRVFGPVMVVWFATLGGLGLLQIVREPVVLAAFDPRRAVGFFADHGWLGLGVLGSVFLVVTGGEALYADLGHFGRRPIRIAWFGVVLPGLLLNYLGQGALLIAEPAAVANPFYAMAPGWTLYPLVVLATVATVIASQALISGAFSLTMQAVQLDLCPRVAARHTSAHERGQVYLPLVNWTLMLASIGLVLGFRSSSALAAAYGVAVSIDMVLTTILFFAVARYSWRWSIWWALPLCLAFLLVDLCFLGGNLLKIPDGGWFPLVVGAIIVTVLSTWKRGRDILGAKLEARQLPMELFLRDPSGGPHRVPGTAVFMTPSRSKVPGALLHSVKHYKVLHETVIFVIVTQEDRPYVSVEERVELDHLGGSFYSVCLHFGYMDRPDVPAALARIDDPALDLRRDHTTYFLGRETVIPAGMDGGMALWRERLFAVLARNALPATAFFALPPNRVVELGAQIEI